jgi:hypothetical protein
LKMKQQCGRKIKETVHNLVQKLILRTILQDSHLEPFVKKERRKKYPLVSLFG